MAGRIRSIKPEWSEDEALIMCSDAARVLSVVLITWADDYGNGRAGPVPVLASRALPANPDRYVGALRELVSIGYAAIYTVDGQAYFAIRNWKKHQLVKNPSKPRVPAPSTEDLRKVSVESPQTLTMDPISRSRSHTPTTTPIPNTAESSLRKVSPAKPKTPSAPSAEQPGYTEAVALWFTWYETTYGTKPPWSAKHGRQLKNIMAEATIEELRDLVPQFFNGPYPDSIRDGHSLSKGYSSFACRLDMLRADLANPKRRSTAAIATKRLQLADDIAAESDATNRMNIQAQASKDPFNDEHWRDDGRRGGKDLAGAPPAAPGSIAQGDRTVGRDTQQKALGSGATRMVQSTGPIREGIPDLGDVSSGVRGRADAIDWPVQADAHAPPGARKI